MDAQYSPVSGWTGDGLDARIVAMPATLVKDSILPGAARQP